MLHEDEAIHMDIIKMALLSSSYPVCSPSRLSNVLYHQARATTAPSTFYNPLCQTVWVNTPQWTHQPPKWQQTQVIQKYIQRAKTSKNLWGYSLSPCVKSSTSKSQDLQEYMRMLPQPICQELIILRAKTSIIMKTLPQQQLIFKT